MESSNFDSVEGYGALWKFYGSNSVEPNHLTQIFHLFVLILAQAEYNWLMQRSNIGSSFYGYAVLFANECQTKADSMKRSKGASPYKSKLNKKSWNLFGNKDDTGEKRSLLNYRLWVRNLAAKIMNKNITDILGMFCWREVLRISWTQRRLNTSPSEIEIETQIHSTKNSAEFWHVERENDLERLTVEGMVTCTRLRNVRILWRATHESTILNED